jgi:hypothetical protein
VHDKTPIYEQLSFELKNLGCGAKTLKGQELLFSKS